MKFQTENEILETVRAFENSTIARAEWRHRQHLIVALYYVLHSPNLTDATRRMRGGIFNLLESFEIDLTKEMPYHETLTVFWIRTVFKFVGLKNDFSIVEICNEAVEKFDKDYPLRFYSRERLFSDAARKDFVEADLPGKDVETMFDYESVSHQN